MTMVGRYVRKTNRQSWNEASMQQAIKDVQEKRMGWLKASKIYNVPQATLRRRAANKNKRVKGVEKSLGRFSITFDSQTEKELVEHLKYLESRLFGLTTTEVRQLAYEFAEKNKLDHRFNREKGIAGKEWLRGLRRRNTDISLRRPEPTSAARARAFNKPQVSKFFEVLDSVLQEKSITVEKIYNMDESGLSTVQKPPKILASTGRKQVGSLTSAERGQHVTVVCCMSATGNYIPPALIFSRKNKKDELFDKAPPGSLGLCQESGWINSELFVQWLKHFCKHANPSPENKVLLLLDGHVSHTSLAAVSFCRENNIILMCFPAHCTHRMQPLDVSFFGPLKAYYNQVCTTWMKNHPGRVITAYQVSELFSEAYGKAATIQNALSGFAKTGISPFNCNIFPDYLFVPADTTDIALEDTEAETPNPLGEKLHDDNQTEEENQPDVVSELPINSNKEDKTVVAKVPFLEISPPPKAIYQSRKRNVTKKYAVLTCSPNLEELKYKNEEQAKKKSKIDARKIKKKISCDNSEEQNMSEAHCSKLHMNLRDQTTKKSPKAIIEDETDEESEPFQETDDEDDASCIYCNGLFRASKSKETWIQCMKCQLWAHLECTDLTPKSKTFICDLCN